MRFTSVLAVGLLFVSVLSCGGSGNSGGGNSGPQFTIASGNWRIDLAGATAGGQLVQNGSNITGTLYVNGSSCFDPIADALVVNGTVASGENVQQALSLSTAPVRGQVISLNATWGREHAPTLQPPAMPAMVTELDGISAINGGSCAVTTAINLPAAQQTFFRGNFSGNMTGQGWTASTSASLDQSGPDTQGFFHVTGTLSVAGSPCFTSGTITSSSIAGDMNQVTITMDSGQLTGSAQRIFDLEAMENRVNFTLTVHGGTCDGQSVIASMFDTGPFQE